jgi:hypothetical protein
MSEIANYRRIVLGQREEQFLKMIAEREGRSAYSIYSELNDGETDHGKARKLPELQTAHMDAMSYKNVHKRIKRLEFLGLIEQIFDGKQKGKEIKYRLTSRGLFQQFLGFQWRGSPGLPLNCKDDIILQTILYRYFQLETVKKLIEIFGSGLFDSFITKCCEAIQWRVDGLLTELELDRRLTIASMFHPENHNGKYIEEMIRNEAKNLVHEIVRESAKDRYKGYFPSPVLMRDEKFKDLLEEIKVEFNRAYKNLVY